MLLRLKCVMYVSVVCADVSFHYQDEIGLKEWALSLRAAHRNSQDLLASMAKKAGKIYGTDGAKEAAGLARAPAAPAAAPNGNN